MKTLVQLAGCEKYYRLSQLNLLDAGSKRTKLFNRAVKYLVTDLIWEGQIIQEETILPRLEVYFGQEYVPEYFACAKECEVERQADYRKLERFVIFLARNRLKPVQKSIMQDIRYPVCINGHSFPTVRCRIDLVFEDEKGSKEAVIISPGRPVYNSRARLAERKPENSPELLAVQCALKSSGIVCGRSSIYYMAEKMTRTGHIRSLRALTTPSPSATTSCPGQIQLPLWEYWINSCPAYRKRNAGNAGFGDYAVLKQITAVQTTQTMTAVYTEQMTDPHPPA